MSHVLHQRKPRTHDFQIFLFHRMYCKNTANLGIDNINFDLHTLICGYKVALTECVNVNLILSLIYKTCLMVYATKTYLNPLVQLPMEIKKNPSNTKAHNFIMWKQFEKKY